MTRHTGLNARVRERAPNEDARVRKARRRRPVRKPEWDAGVNGTGHFGRRRPLMRRGWAAASSCHVQGSNMRRDENLSFLKGGGEMGERTRELDWSRTPVGPPAEWPQSLKTAVSICLGSRHPIVLWWGPRDYTQFYNDAYIP